MTDDTRKVKKQHQVPQFYLRQYAGGEQLFVFDKPSRRSFQANITDIGCRHYYYDLPGEYLPEGTDLQMVEKALSAMEARFATALEKVLGTLARKRRLNQAQKRMMA